MSDILPSNGTYFNDTDDSEKGSFAYFKKTFIISLVLAFLIIAPFVIVEWIKTGKPVFLYFGDYNAQQIPFYEHCVRAVHNGQLGWDWMTDLGSNFVGSYSYYLLGSPFFWIMCLFPASWAPCLMAPIYILKFATAAVTSFAYLKRFVKNKDYAVIGSLLYAFSGFQIYNIFFNQFHEVVAFFPLLLIGIEETVQNGRHGPFALAVALNCMCNYFMFAGQVVFCIMYFMFRCFKKSFRISLKNFICLAVEAVLGVLIGAVLFLPASLAVMDNPRLGGTYSGWKMLFFTHYNSDLGKDTIYTERYLHIIESYFFPPDIPSRVNFAYGHTERWASNAIWLPLFGMSGIFSYIAARKRSWVSQFSMFLMLCSVVPLLNSTFFLLNSSYYARWNYMMILIFAVGTIIALEDREISFKPGLITSAVACAAIAVPVGLIWFEKDDEFQLGKMPFPGRFWICVLISFGSLIAIHFITKYMRGRYTSPCVSIGKDGKERICRGRNRFTSAVLIAVCSACVLFSVCHIFQGKCHSWSSDFLVDRAIDGKVELPEDEFSRIDFYRKEGKFTSIMDNLGLYWEIPSVVNFHTVVPRSIMDFYDLNGIRRSVGSRVESTYYGLRGLLSVKYSFIPTEKTQKHDAPGFKYFDTQNGFDIYKNEYFLPPGFTFDEFMTETDFKDVAKSLRHTLFCQYLVVPDDKADFYSSFMTRVYNRGEAPDGAPVRKAANRETYKNSVLDRAKNVCSDFRYDSYGFKASFNSEKDRVVFFSVPYESGWSVKVNGLDSDVLKVDSGFMAVKVPAGENDIEFSYKTPGLAVGAIISVCGLALWAVYLLICKKIFPKKAYKFFSEDYYEQETEKEYLTKKEFKAAYPEPVKPENEPESTLFSPENDEIEKEGEIDEPGENSVDEGK